MSVDELLPFLRDNQVQLIRQLKEGKYRPNPVRKVEIPKETKGEFRKLGVPTAVDRVFRQATAQVLSPIYEEQFSENSFDFRPKRGVHDALKQCQQNANEWICVCRGHPSIYRKVLQMNEQGYLESSIVKGDKFADKAVYSITEKGRAYLGQLMETYASQKVPLLFDFNVVITNLNKMEREKALDLIKKLRDNFTASAKSIDEYAASYPDIPLGGKAIFEQQRLLYQSLLEWLAKFESQFRGS